MSFSGYANVIPNSNVNMKYANIDNSHYPGGFGSNEIPGQNGLPGLSGAKNNVDAAQGYVPGICLKGGGKKLKRKIKNIIKKYKTMKGKKSHGLKRKTHRLKQLAKSRKFSHRKGMKTNKRRTRSHSRRRLRGGYSQYQNNLPMTPTYSVGARLTSSDSALANPPPIQSLCNSTNCVDNYNHYTGKGFDSRGH